MLKEKEYYLQSVCAMIMHNGQLADPLNEFSRAIKIISSKRKKTDADHEEMARLEFLGSLYMDENGPIIPARTMRAMIVNAARKRREGKLAEAGVFVVENASLDYDGPRGADELWEAKINTSREIVRVGQARVVRTRPIFHEWEAVVKVLFDDSVVSGHQLDEWMEIGGSIVGLMEMRPQMGRFTVVESVKNGNYGKPKREKVLTR